MSPTRRRATTAILTRVIVFLSTNRNSNLTRITRRCVSDNENIKDALNWLVSNRIVIRGMFQGNRVYWVNPKFRILRRGA